MSIGLVVYFAYSYSHSHLGDGSAAASDDLPTNYTPPIAAIIAIVLAIILTIVQVTYLMPNTGPIDYVVRLFFWAGTGILVYMLMYGKQDAGGARSASVKSMGLLISLVNLVVWIGVTYWLLAMPHK